jgi:DNA-binding GntR family transcriptional regulator
MDTVLRGGGDDSAHRSTDGSCYSGSDAFSLCSLDVGEPYGVAQARLERILHTSRVPSVSTGRPEVPAGSAAARAYRYVKDRLLDGRYPGGALLSENELARELGISRTPVRQAFVQLETEELLDLYPRRGALVRPVSMSETEDVFEARLLIETHCVRRVAAQGPGLAAVLREAIARQERSLQDGEVGFIAADRAFHHTIVAANHNAILVRQYDALRDRLQRITAALVARDPARVAQFIGEHRDIAGAIEQRDADRAVSLIEAHLRGAHELVQRRHH